MISIVWKRVYDPDEGTLISDYKIELQLTSVNGSHIFHISYPQTSPSNVPLQIYDSPAVRSVVKHCRGYRLHRHHDVDSGQILTIFSQK